MLPHPALRSGRRHRPVALFLVVAAVALITLGYSLRTYDFVSLGMAKYLPYTEPTASSPSTHFQVPQRQGRVSLTIGSLNIRYSHDARYDSAQSTLQSLKQIFSLAPPQFSTGLAAGSPYLMKQYWGERSWLLRGPKVADIPLFYDWDLFAMQEVLDGQFGNLVAWLGDEYDHAGVGRDDGKRAGEAVPVFWRKDVFARAGIKDGGVGTDGVEHFWLSPTPDRPGSVGWDAALTRMCTHVSLTLLATGEIVHVFSTHYDHQGVEARAKSSELIVQRARQASRQTQEFYRAQRVAQKQAVDQQGGAGSWGLPPTTASIPGAADERVGEPLVVLLGDLNSPRNEGSWSTLIAGHYALPHNSTGHTFLDTALSVPTRVRSPYLTDNEDPLRSNLASGRVLPQAPADAPGGVMSEPAGSLRTFTDFSPSPRNAIDDRIDFVLLLANSAVEDETRADAVLDHSPSAPPPPRKDIPATARDSTKWKIRSFGVLPNWSESDAGFLISDHRPVMSRIERTIATHTHPDTH